MADIIKCQKCGIIIGQYVSLSEHENLMADFVVAQAQLFNLPAMSKLLAKIEAENQKLEALLQRWNEIADTLTDDLQMQSHVLAQLISDTSEAIK